MVKNLRHNGTQSFGLTQLSYGRRLLLLACIFVVMMFFSGLCDTFLGKLYQPMSRPYLLALSICQNVICFIGTAVLTSIFVSTKPISLLGLNKGCKWMNIFGILLLFAISLPMMNQIIYWNESMSLPQFMGKFETVLKDLENSAALYTSTMLDTHSLTGLLVSVLTVGVLTGFSEELLFRGALQRLIATGTSNKHLAVWIAAVIFSLMHFQFYGFIPRILLGAFFGYIFLWTGSIWASAIAHAINNSIYVIISWCELNGFSLQNPDKWGISYHGFPLWATVSLIMVVVVLVVWRKNLFGKTS